MVLNPLLLKTHVSKHFKIVFSADVAQTPPYITYE